MNVRRHLCSLSLLLLTGWGCTEPTQECKTFIACRAYYEGAFSLPALNVNRFRSEGVCWESQDLADACTEECVSLTDGMREDLIDALKPAGPCGLAAAPADAGTLDAGS